MQKISTWVLSLCIPLLNRVCSCYVHGHDVLVLIFKLSSYKRFVGVFSYKGVPGVKYGVYYACIFYVMLLLSAAFKFIVHCLVILLIHG
jgi:hypothetical protein